MGFPFGFKRDFCKNLTRSGKCRETLDRCVFITIPLPPNNTLPSWQKTLEYIKAAPFDCPQTQKGKGNGNKEIVKWLLQVTRQLTKKVERNLNI